MKDPSPLTREGHRKKACWRPKLFSTQRLFFVLMSLWLCCYWWWGFFSLPLSFREKTGTSLIHYQGNSECGLSSKIPIQEADSRPLTHPASRHRKWSLCWPGPAKGNFQHFVPWTRPWLFAKVGLTHSLQAGSCLGLRRWPCAADRQASRVITQSICHTVE